MNVNIFKRIFYFISYKLVLFKNILLNHITYIFKNKKNIIFINGHPDSKNFGDALNIPIVQYLSGKNVLPAKYFNAIYSNKIKYSVIGSIIQWSPTNSIIWGSGIIDENSKINQPKTICAVRGKLTRMKLLDSGFKCPEIYGDPALILPLLYSPKLPRKKFKYGLLVHYIDKNNNFVRQIGNLKEISLKVIDIEVGVNYKQLIDSILECEVILTSSLHGIIVAQAYKLPFVHISLSDNITGGMFKFKDYFSSVNIDFKKPLIINRKLDSYDFELEINNDIISIDISRLIDVCPFIKSDLKKELLETLKKPDFKHLARN